MDIAATLTRIAAELALFAGAGFLLFAINDVLVDVIYFTRRLWRGLTVYSRYPRAFASYFVFKKNPGFLAILVPAWDESAVIASMLKSTLDRLDYDDFPHFRRPVPQRPGDRRCNRQRRRSQGRSDYD